LKNPRYAGALELTIVIARAFTSINPISADGAPASARPGRDNSIAA